MTCHSERSEESPGNLSPQGSNCLDSHLHDLFSKSRAVQVSLPSVVQNDMMFSMLGTPRFARGLKIQTF
jgi:hypothetical protein